MARTANRPMQIARELLQPVFRALANARKHVEEKNSDAALACLDVLTAELLRVEDAVGVSTPRTLFDAPVEDDPFQVAHVVAEAQAAGDPRDPLAGELLGPNELPYGSMDKLSKRQLACKLRDERRSLEHNGRKSWSGKQSKKAIAAVEAEYRRRGLEIPKPGYETASWDREIPAGPVDDVDVEGAPLNEDGNIDDFPDYSTADLAHLMNELAAEHHADKLGAGESWDFGPDDVRAFRLWFADADLTDYTPPAAVQTWLAQEANLS